MLGSLAFHVVFIGGARSRAKGGQGASSARWAWWRDLELFAGGNETCNCTCHTRAFCAGSVSQCVSTRGASNEVALTAGAVKCQAIHPMSGHDSIGSRSDTGSGSRRASAQTRAPLHEATGPVQCLTPVWARKDRPLEGSSATCCIMRQDEVMAARISASCNPACLAILWSRRRHRHAGTEQHGRGDAQDDERRLQDRWAAPGYGNQVPWPRWRCPE